MNPPLIILDRDGVINEDSDLYVKSVNEWQPITGSIEAIARLHKAGYRVTIATNQSGLARGYFDEIALQQMHQKMMALVDAAGGEIAAIEFCPHGPQDACACRKPLPGMIYTLLEKFSNDSRETWVVGDSIRDLEAGLAAGCKVALVLTGKGEKSRTQLQQNPNTLPNDYTPPVYHNLSQFVDSLLSKEI